MITIQLNAAPRLHLTGDVQLGLQFLAQPCAELRQTVANIIASNPYLAFIEPTSPQEDDWGFIERRDEPFDWETFIHSPEEDLYASIFKQIVDLDTSPLRQRVCIAWLDCLDKHGRLTLDAHDIAHLADCSSTEASNALLLCQTFEPRGLFARDITECFALQLTHRPDTQAFVRQHLSGILAQGVKSYCAIGEYIIEHVRAHLNICRLLRRTFCVAPREGFNQVEAMISVAKDAVVVTWANDIRVEKIHRALRHSEPAKWNEATAVTRMLYRREDTIMRTITAIAEVQKEYFLTRDDRLLKPLNLATIGNMVELHQTTIGRAITGKSIAFGIHVIPLSFFFSARVGVEDSSTAIKARLADLIAEYPALSDTLLAHAMYVKHKIVVARRTVAKYRDELGIRGKHRR